MTAMDNMVLTETGVGDALTTDRKSARRARIEVITRGERRRSWSEDQKREMVVASLQPGARPADIAREHGINTGLLYTWRRQMLEGELGAMVQPLPSFARVEIAAAVPPATMSARSAPQSVTPGPVSAPAAPCAAPGRIEIMLPGGVSLRVDAEVDSRALRRVLAALEGR